MTEQLLDRLVQDLMRRPSKRLRAGLVRAGFVMASGEMEISSQAETWLGTFCDAIEGIHGGSLVVDDIQDGSADRRGAPALHHTYGIPLALNAGNAMYFASIAKFPELKMEMSQELWAYRLYARALASAHRGQAIDLGVRVDVVAQTEIAALAEQCVLQKSGALTGLAMAWGAVAAREENRAFEFESLGCRYGQLLQIFDDLGNVVSVREPSKRMEDVMAGKPGWIWSTAAQIWATAEWQLAMEEWKSGDRDALEARLRRTGILTEARQRGDHALVMFKNELNEKFPGNSGAQQLIDLAEKLRGAYT